MISEAIAIFLYLINIMFISGLYKLNKDAVLVGAVVNMCLIAVFAQRHLDFFGFSSNIGNVFYAAVFFAFSLAAYHKDEFMEKLHAIFGTVLIFALMGQVIQALPVHNQEVADALSVVTGTTIRIATASFLAFYVSNGINYVILNMNKLALWHRKLIGNFTGQLVDSLIFFPVAFAGVLPAETVFGFTVSGLVIKVFLNAVDTPIFLRLVKLR